MKTRIKIKTRPTKRIDQLAQAELFVYQGSTEVWQVGVAVGAVYGVHRLEDAIGSVHRGNEKVIPVARAEILPDEWQIAEYKPNAIHAGDLDIGEYFCWALNGHIYQKGVFDGDGVKYWDITVPTKEFRGKVTEIAIPLEPISIDSDKTLVFTTQ